MEDEYIDTMNISVPKIILKNKIELVKQRIGELSDKHEHYMSISPGNGSMATDIIEQRQQKLFTLLDCLNKEYTQG